MEITEGCHDIDEATYHADPCPEPSLSASICSKLLSASPLHAWHSHPRLNPDHKCEESSKFDIGTAAHAMLLSSGRRILLVDGFADYKKKEAQQLREEARLQGMVPLLSKQLLDTQSMISCLRKQLSACEGAADVFSDGLAEQTLVWREGEIWCRARVDYLRPNKAGSTIDDYKTTTNASPYVWQRQLFGLGDDLQAAFYRRGYRAVFGVEPGPFRFVVQEISPPYAVSVVQLDPYAVAKAEEKITIAIQVWQRCLRSGKWPGYAEMVHYASPPGWAESAFNDKLYAMQFTGLVDRQDEPSREFDPRRIFA